MLYNEGINKKGIWHHDSLFIRFTYSFIRATLGTLVKLIWVKKVYGMENMPKTGSLIVANEFSQTGKNHKAYIIDSAKKIDKELKK